MQVSIIPFLCLWKHAKKPRAFKPGDEWHPGAEPALWRSGGKSGIIWLWPDMQRVLIQNTGFNIISYGSQNIAEGCSKAKYPSASKTCYTRHAK
jgi:hypothetical protein